MMDLPENVEWTGFQVYQDCFFCGSKLKPNKEFEDIDGMKLPLCEGCVE